MRTVLAPSETLGVHQMKPVIPPHLREAGGQQKVTDTDCIQIIN